GLHLQVPHRLGEGAEIVEQFAPRLAPLAHPLLALSLLPLRPQFQRVHHAMKAPRQLLSSSGHTRLLPHSGWTNQRPQLATGGSPSTGSGCTSAGPPGGRVDPNGSAMLCEATNAA